MTTDSLSRTLELPAKRDAFVTLKGFIEELALELALSDKLRKQLLIVADEVFTNIALYGYPKTEGDAKVVVALDGATRELTLTFIDAGVPFNPLEVQEPDITAPAAERQIGGLGMFMVKRLMDSVTYEHRDNQNILTLKKCVL